jgi:VCBS repeat protein
MVRLFAAAVLAAAVCACGDTPAGQRVDPTRDSRRSILPKGAPSDFFAPQPIGNPIRGNERPRIAHIEIADLDGDGLPDVLVCDAVQNRVTWIRQAPRGVYTEQPIAIEIAAPGHVQAIDVDRDGDLDLVVASLGVLFPDNRRIGSVVILENDGRQQFIRHIAAEGIPRVADVRAGDLDGDGDLDLAVAGFGYDEGETLWLENSGSWQFKPHVLQRLSGAINAVIVDINGDGAHDIVALVSQEWEEVWAFVNDGKGNFTSKLIWGSTNPDFGSSWITVADLDRDGDPDVLYSNGDAFDYAPPTGRGWNGLQWLENRGGFRFRYHRIGDFSGASSPQAVDLDGDGDLDIALVSAYNNWDRPDAFSLAWFENDGTMTFTLRPVTGTPTHLITLAVGDMNKDGRPDLVTGGMHMSYPFDRMSRVTIWMHR